MKSRLFIMIIGTAFLVCNGALNGFCGDVKNVKPLLNYGTFIDDYAQKCEAKAALLDSGSVNIRKDAMRATIKGTYLRHNRANLVKYLMEKEAPLNPYRWRKYRPCSGRRKDPPGPTRRGTKLCWNSSTPPECE